MSAGFTPGPWRVDPNYASDIQTADGALEIAGVAASILCGGEKPQPEARFANARLIAAAPELYAELQQFVNGVETRMIDSPADETLANITARAKAALAKANGEQVHSDPLPKEVGR